MRKVFIIPFILFAFTGTSFGFDACYDLDSQNVEYIGEITSQVNVRTLPCKSKGAIITKAYNGDSFSVVAKNEYWYQIKLDNGKKGWVWYQNLTESNSKYTKKYNLTSSDKVLVKKIVSKLQKIVDQYGLEYKAKLIKSLKNTYNKSEKYSKLNELLKEILEQSKDTSFEKEYNSHYSEFNINFDKVKKEWIAWHNTERRNVGSSSYSNDKRLDSTAYEWSNIQNQKGVMEHKRSVGDSYYDYNKIESWFQERGVKCEVKGGATSSESIGKFAYYCKDGDCSDELIKSLKVIYNIYLAEKGQSYDAHYRAIVHQNLSKIGLGISITKSSDKNFYDYYVTTHYCTNFVD